MPRAKERYLLTGNVKAHRDLVVSENFERACEAAMLETMGQMTFTSDVASATANAYRLQGAALFLENLRTIADEPKPEPKNLLKQLNPNV